jgi:hypothetical protein
MSSEAGRHKDAFRADFWVLSGNTRPDKDTVTEDAFVSRLMDQIASRAASELRRPRPSTPE